MSSLGQQIEDALSITGPHAYIRSHDKRLFQRLCVERHHTSAQVSTAQALNWYSDNQPSTISCLFDPRPVSSASLFVHGSWADRTAGPYADLDIVAVLWREAFNSFACFCLALEEIRELMRASLKLDPLQHHVPRVIVETELTSSKSNWLVFPPLFSERLHLVGGVPPHAVALGTTPGRAALKGQLCRVLTMLRSLEGFNPQFAFNAKALVSTVLLLPAVLLQCQGILISKRDSFTEYRGALSAEVELASRIRAEWSYTGARLARAVRASVSFGRGAAVLRRLAAVQIENRLYPAARELRNRIPDMLAIAQHEGREFLSAYAEGD